MDERISELTPIPTGPKSTATTFARKSTANICII